MQTTMKQVTSRLVNEIQGCKLGYTQSDEISLLLTDFDNIKTHAWFDGNLQKMASISSAMTSVYFNNTIKEFKPDCGDAFFDARVFTIPEKNEVINYFLWRHRDCVKNSISMLARSIFSHKKVHKLNGGQMIEKMIKEEGVDWNKEQNNFRYGTFIIKDNQISRDFDFDSLSDFISSLISQ
jgi:tRNA(His) 5'-end guanylyltransferase